MEDQHNLEKVKHEHTRFFPFFIHDWVNRPSMGNHKTAVVRPSIRGQISEMDHQYHQSS